VTKKFRFADLFAGLGGFHLALSGLGHECVFACDNNQELRGVYEDNFGICPEADLREVLVEDIPSHDILCAGFPCQPFSKAGEQLGTSCKLWGDLFEDHVLRVLSYHLPSFFIFENVANLERHDGGRTWKRMKRQLANRGYAVDAKILSPHQFGIPQIRQRLFIVGSRNGLDGFSWPKESKTEPSIHNVLDQNPSDAKQLSTQVTQCLIVWNRFIKSAPKDVQLPSFPIWAMEFGATYPFTKYSSLHRVPMDKLRNFRGSFGCSLNCDRRSELMLRLPSYARSRSGTFPTWKQNFIAQNRRFYRDNKCWISPMLKEIKKFPPSLQKLEWNCKGEKRNIWNYVIQFRASGVRIKRPVTAPSLVAMTTTQVPIIGWEKRYMTTKECCRLQSLQKLKSLPKSASSAHRALGNAVNSTIVKMIAKKLLSKSKRSNRQLEVSGV
jgi:DNA (cytosine-5)-methyltransferase 1